MIIEVTYNVTDVYMSTTVSPIYITVDYSGSGGSGASVWGSITGTLSNQTDLQTALDDKVPYTGATEDVNLGEWEMKAGQFTLDTSPTGIAAVGTTQWNDTIGSSQTTLKGGSVVLKNGVDLVARIVNKVSPNTTLTKAAYQAVRVSGAQGQRLAVAFAQANNDNNSADTIGLVIETIATNQEGFIITVGQIDGINTTGSLQGETWSDGDVLYLSPTVAGALTNVKPTGATGHIVIIGYVEYAHANNGKIYVKVMNGWELDELHNVYISSVANNQGLFYESSSSLWKNKSISTVLGYTPEQPMTFSSPLSRSTNTVSIPSASSSANGYLSSTDWSTFNGKQGALTLTTTGTSGAATLVGNTLNIPQYSGGGGMAIGGSITSATAGSVLFAGTSGVLAQDNSNLFWDNTNKRLGINTNTPGVNLDVLGSGSVGNAYLRVTRTNNTTGDAYFITQPQGTLSSTNKSWNYGLGLGSNMFRFLAFDGSVPTTYFGIFNNGNVLIQNGGTFTDAGYRLDVNGTMRVQDSLTVSKNQNAVTDIIVSNTTNGTGAYSRFRAINNSSYEAQVFITSSSWSAYGALGGDTGGYYTNATNGLALLTDNNSPIRFLTGFSSGNTEKVRIFGNTGNVTIQNGGTFTDAGYRLDVNGTMRVQSKISLSAGTTSNAQINLASSTAPTSPNNGDIWYDGTDIKMRIGGVTKTFTLV